MDDNSIPLAPWAQTPQQNTQSSSGFPLAPWAQPQKPNAQVQLPPGSSADPDPVTRFLNSFGSAVTSPISAAQEMLTPHSNAEKQAQIQHAMDVYSQLQSKDPKIQQSARDQIISALPFGSTYLKARNGDIAGAVGDIGGIGALGAAMGGTGAALDSDLAQSLGSGIKAGAGDVAAGTAKAATGTGVAVGAHALGLGPFGEYMLAKPLIVNGLKQVGQGVKAGVEEGKTRYSLLKDPGDITFKNPSAAEQQAYESPVNTTKITTPKSITYKDSQNPTIAKELQLGTKRTMPDGSTQILRSVPIDDISGDPGNQIWGKLVDEYQQNGYTVHPELRDSGPNGDTKYTINEGHHRILSDVKNGKTNITTWVPLEQNP